MDLPWHTSSSSSDHKDLHPRPGERSVRGQSSTVSLPRAREVPRKAKGKIPTPRGRSPIETRHLLPLPKGLCRVKAPALLPQHDDRRADPTRHAYTHASTQRATDAGTLRGNPWPAYTSITTLMTHHNRREGPQRQGDSHRRPRPTRETTSPCHNVVSRSPPPRRPRPRRLRSSSPPPRIPANHAARAGRRRGPITT